MGGHRVGASMTRPTSTVCPPSSNSESNAAGQELPAGQQQGLPSESRGTHTSRDAANAESAQQPAPAAPSSSEQPEFNVYKGWCISPTKCRDARKCLGPCEGYDAAERHTEKEQPQLRPEWEARLYADFDEPMTHKDVARFVRSMIVPSATAPYDIVLSKLREMESAAEGAENLDSAFTIGGCIQQVEWLKEAALASTSDGTLDGTSPSLRKMERSNDAKRS